MFDAVRVSSGTSQLIVSITWQSLISTDFHFRIKIVTLSVFTVYITD